MVNSRVEATNSPTQGSQQSDIATRWESETDICAQSTSYATEAPDRDSVPLCRRLFRAFFIYKARSTYEGQTLKSGHIGGWVAIDTTLSSTDKLSCVPFVSDRSPSVY